jgi:transposase-like protein
MKTCPYCGSTNICKKGVVHSITGDIQRYKCHDCGKRCTENTVTSVDMPAVLVMDIETLPIKAYVWGPWEQNIQHNQVIEDWCVLCWSAKWLDDPRMIHDCLTPKEAVARNDLRIVKSMWKLFDDADIIIAQNGKKFDIPKMNTRFWKYQMDRPASYKIIDTLDTARRVFGMTWNNLDYLGEYLGLGKKVKTDFGLWVDCDHGDQEALKYMQRYNENDVTLLERIYLKMRGWMPGHPRFTTYEKVVGVCPVCMDANIRNIGLYTAVVRQYKEFRCEHCGAVWHNTKPEK